MRFHRRQPVRPRSPALAPTSRRSTSATSPKTGRSQSECSVAVPFVREPMSQTSKPLRPIRSTNALSWAGSTCISCGRTRSSPRILGMAPNARPLPVPCRSAKSPPIRSLSRRSSVPLSGVEICARIRGGIRPGGAWQLAQACARQARYGPPVTPPAFSPRRWPAVRVAWRHGRAPAADARIPPAG